MAAVITERKSKFRVISQAEWMAEAKSLFGEVHPREWKFSCPVCKTPQSMVDLVEVGVDKDKVQNYIGFSCIGRFTDTKGCDWTLGGLFQIHTLEVIGEEDGQNRKIFEFHRESDEVLEVAK